MGITFLSSLEIWALPNISYMCVMYYIGCSLMTCWYFRVWFLKSFYEEIFTWIYVCNKLTFLLQHVEFCDNSFFYNISDSTLDISYKSFSITQQVRPCQQVFSYDLRNHTKNIIKSLRNTLHIHMIMLYFLSYFLNVGDFIAEGLWISELKVSYALKRATSLQ